MNLEEARLSMIKSTYQNPLLLNQSLATTRNPALNSLGMTSSMVGQQFTNFANPMLLSQFNYLQPQTTTLSHANAIPYNTALLTQQPVYPSSSFVPNLPINNYPPTLTHQPSFLLPSTGPHQLGHSLTSSNSAYHLPLHHNLNHNFNHNLNHNFNHNFNPNLNHTGNIHHNQANNQNNYSANLTVTNQPQFARQTILPNPNNLWANAMNPMNVWF